MRGLTWMGRFTVPGLVTLVLVVTTIIGCGGGSTKDTLIPGETFDSQAKVIQAFDVTNPNDTDKNGIETQLKLLGYVFTEKGVLVNGKPVWNGKIDDRLTMNNGIANLKVADPTAIKMAYSVLGYGFPLPGGQRQDHAIGDETYTRDGDEQGICYATTQIGDLPETTSDLSVPRQQDETFNISPLVPKPDEKSPKTVPWSVTIGANPLLAQHKAAQNMGLKDIPDEHRIEVEKNNPSGLIFGLASIALAYANIQTGNVVGIGCGDPYFTFQGNFILERTEVIVPPPPAAPYLVVDCPEEVEEGKQIVFGISANGPVVTVEREGAQVATLTNNGSNRLQYKETAPEVSADTLQHYKFRMGTLLEECDVLVKNVVVVPNNQNPIIDDISCVVTGKCVDITLTAHDPDGSITNIHYNFGDGGTLGELDTTDNTVSHCYETVGDKTVTVTVTDDKGATATKSCMFTISDGGNNTGTLGYNIVGPGGDADHHQQIGDGWELNRNIEVFRFDENHLRIKTYTVSELTTWMVDGMPSWATSDVGKVYTAYDPDHDGNFNDTVDTGSYFLNMGFSDGENLVIELIVDPRQTSSVRSASALYPFWVDGVRH